MAVGRDAHNAAPSEMGGCDVQTALAVEGQSLRPAQAAKEDADLAVAIDPRDVVKTRGGGAGDVQFALPG